MMSVLAILSTRIELSGLSAEQTEAIRAKVTYPNPRYETALRLGNVPFGIEPTLTSLVVRDDGIVEVPRGCTGIVREVVPDVRWTDLRHKMPRVALPAVAGLRDYQKRAVAAAVRGQQGVLVLPTGAGKTATGLALVAEVGQPALIVVPTLDLAEQWRMQTVARLGIAPAVCAGGQVRHDLVTIAVVNTLRDQARIARLSGEVGIVIVDECHHVPATTFAGVIESFGARWRIGLTATPDRTDGLGVLLQHYLGRELYRVEVSELAESGHLVRPTYRQVHTDFAYPYAGPESWHDTLTALVDDDDRNRLIVDTIREDHDGHPALVLTGRVAHAEELASRLAASGLRADAIHGELPKRTRLDILEQVRAGELDALVGTTVADEGLDVPSLTRLYLTFPSRSEGRLLQRIGRIVRPAPDKPAPEVIDFVDERVGPLKFQAKKRAATFARTWQDEAA